MSKPPLPDKIRCDLCSDLYPLREIPYTYVTKNDVETEEEARAKNEFWAEDSDWAVCQQCHELIEMGSLERLIHYSITRQLGRAAMLGPNGLEPIPEEIAEPWKAEIRRVHTLFWAMKHEVHPEPGYRVPA